ncbi:hypothetical protein [Kutzneria chonburiensis]|uniref:Uncharacterized protein n=1 Tax=Kutzneria chonburiensis TaxID=1483604 RepID=A0ABV6MSB7_9PSEU|nr:hypothetical protein [Kutzneria chonburiensis]
MDRAGILDEQSRAAKVLIEIIRTGIPAMEWFIATDVPRCVYGSPGLGFRDSEGYLKLTHCAERLGMQLKVTPPAPGRWISTGSTGSEANCSPVEFFRSDEENYRIEGVYRGVQVSFKGSAPEGTAKHTTVPKLKSHQARQARRARLRDPVVTAQLQAVTVLIGLLSADLPPVCWRIDPPKNREPQLNVDMDIHTYSRHEARVELTRWAEFLGTPIHYEVYRNAQVTTRVDGVSITITATLRRPLSDTRPWQALRRQLTRITGGKPTTTR